MIDSDVGLEKHLRQAISSLAIADPDKLVQRRIARLKIFARPALGPMASDFENAVALTELGHKLCGSMLSSSTLLLNLKFSPETIWPMASLERRRLDKNIPSDEVKGLSPDMLNTIFREKSEIRDQLVTAMVDPKNQGRLPDIINELFGSDQEKLKRATHEGAFLNSAKATVEGRIVRAQATVFLGLLGRFMFYWLIVGKIGAGLEREVTLQKVNEVVNDIPAQLVSIIPGLHFVDHLRTLVRLIQAFREKESGLADLADDIANAQAYVTTYMSALKFWHKEFRQVVDNVTAALREINPT